MSTSRFSPAGRTYIWGVILTGLAIIIWSLCTVYADGTSARWLVFAALTAISSSAGVGLIAVPASLSVSDTFVFAALLLYGPAAGTLTVAIDGLVASSCMSKATRRPDRMLFNVSAPTIAVWSAAEIFFAIGGFPPTGVGSAPLNSLLAPFALCAVSYFLMNSGLIATAVAFETGVRPTRIWRRDFAWLSINHFAAASLALLLVASTRYLDLIQVMLLAPVLMVVYFTLKTTMDRVRDSNDHLIQVNRLYLSTIEALAMAIDAKDQVTHGHIRRVQTYAIGLARKLGVKDEGLIKAIEAAALFHDTGKIAIPEHILNKPGRLTAAEFERMKTMRGLAPTSSPRSTFRSRWSPSSAITTRTGMARAIPTASVASTFRLGRILSVVDCFDALTSDRPDRRAMSEAEANEILLERRGRNVRPARRRHLHRGAARNCARRRGRGRTASGDGFPDGRRPAEPRPRGPPGSARRERQGSHERGCRRRSHAPGSRRVARRPADRGRHRTAGYSPRSRDWRPPIRRSSTWTMSRPTGWSPARRPA